MVHFSGIVQHVQDKSVTVIVDTISFLKNKARPSAKTLAMLSKLHHVSPQPRPTTAAQRCAKRRAKDRYVENWFEEEKGSFDSD